MTVTEFFVGNEGWLSILGWHVAIFVALYCGWRLAHYTTVKRRR